MKKYILLLSASLFLASCSSTDDVAEELIDEELETVEETKEVVQLSAREQADNQVLNQYFSNLSEFPREKGVLFSDVTENGYWLRGNGFPVHGESYFSADGLIYISYDSKLDQIEIANLLVEGATIQDVPLEEELYVSWIYDFKLSELQDLVQVNAKDEPQDFIIEDTSIQLEGNKEDKTYILESADVYYIESVDNSTFLYTETDVFENKERLYHFEEKLSKKSFVQINKSTLLNMDYLDHVNPLPNYRLEAHLKSGDRLIISRHYMKRVKEYLNI